MTKYQNESDRIEAATERGRTTMDSQRQPADRLSHERGNQVREKESATRTLKQADDDIARYLREHGPSDAPFRGHCNLLGDRSHRQHQRGGAP